MWILKGILTVVSFVSKAIQALELALAYRAGVHAQVLADRNLQLQKLMAEAQAGANAPASPSDVDDRLKGGSA